MYWQQKPLTVMLGTVTDEQPDIPGPYQQSSETTTRILWQKVTGDQLVELMFGLLGAMGAKELVWRAGAIGSITATDGGRDIEATFDRPSPDGELDRQKWWVECKSRNDTLDKSRVQDAILNASGKSELDFFIIATSGRFTNPTRDWVSEFSRTHPRPVIKLWDRDRLDRLTRQYPTVAARVLPEVLSDKDRLQLLVDRFQELGEEPTVSDRNYFWSHSDWLKGQESDLLSQAVAMFLYAEGLRLPRQRTWWSLIVRDDLPYPAVTALLGLPRLMGLAELPRPAEMIRLLAASSRILAACFFLLPEGEAVSTITDPWQFVVGGEAISENSEKLANWQHDFLRPILSFLQSELLDACASDCCRVTADNPHEPDSLTAKKFWKVLLSGESEEESTLVIELKSEPCTVGLDVKNDGGCPLILSNSMPIEDAVRKIHKVIKFRTGNPDDSASRRLGSFRGPLTVTFLEENGLVYSSKDFNAPSKEASEDPERPVTKILDITDEIFGKMRHQIEAGLENED